MASGKVKEATLRTTQGNLGLKGHALDHSTGGCTIIALLIVSASLVNIASSYVIEKKYLKRGSNSAELINAID